MTCKTCGRLHEESQPCPRRIAAFYVGATSREELTDADNEWVKDNGIDILEIVEEELANRMA